MKSNRQARLAIGVIIIAGIAASCGRDAGGDDAAALVRKAEQSLLLIEIVPSGPAGLQRSSFAAAALVIRPGFAVTATHVVERAKI